VDYHTYCCHSRNIFLLRAILSSRHSTPCATLIYCGKMPKWIELVYHVRTATLYQIICGQELTGRPPCRSGVELRNCLALTGSWHGHGLWHATVSHLSSGWANYWTGLVSAATPPPGQAESHKSKPISRRFAEQDFYRPNALPVAKMTAPNHWRENKQIKTI